LHLQRLGAAEPQRVKNSPSNALEVPWAVKSQEVSSGFNTLVDDKLYGTWEMNPFHQTFSGQRLQA
jgi:hypothetical protein